MPHAQFPITHTAAAKRDEKTYAIIGAAMAVHGELGCGFLEAIYQEALHLELAALEIPYVREHPIRVKYRGNLLKTAYRCDFLSFDEIIVELKAVQNLSAVDEAQIINYPKATGIKKALLLNFGAPSLQYKRLVLGLEPGFSRSESA